MDNLMVWVVMLLGIVVSQDLSVWGIMMSEWYIMKWRVMGDLGQVMGIKVVIITVVVVNSLMDSLCKLGISVVSIMMWNLMVSIMGHIVVSTWFIVMDIHVVGIVMKNVSVWVVGIIVVLHPFVGVNELVLVIIISMIVLLWLESVVLPVIRVHTVVITLVVKLVVIVSVVSLVVVWSSVSVEIWDSVVVISHVSIGMTVVVIPRVLLVVSVLTVVLSVITVISPFSPVSVVVDWGIVGVIMVISVSVVLFIEVIMSIMSVMRVSLMAVSVNITVVLIMAPWKIVSLDSVSVVAVVVVVVRDVSDVRRGESEVSSVMIGISMESMLHNNFWGSVNVVLNVWANVSIVMIIEVNLSIMVVWSKVLFVSEREVLWSMDIVVIVRVMSPVIPMVVRVVISFSGSMKQLLENWLMVLAVSIVGIVSIVMGGSHIWVSISWVVIMGLEVSNWLVMVGVAVDILTVVWLHVGSLNSGV